MSVKRVLRSVPTLLGLICLHGATLTGAAAAQGVVTSVAVDPREPATIYAGTTDRGVLKSVDGAVTWSATGLGDAVASVTIVPTTPLTLFAATYERGLLRSRDGGATWTATTQTPALGRVLVDPHVPTTLYAVGAPRFEGDPAAGVFKSIDAGDTWSLSLSNAALSNGPFRAVTLAISRPDPAVAGILFAGLVFESSESQQGYLMRSTDGGAAWELTPGGGPFWTESGLVVDPLVPTSLYGAGGSILRSTDAGDIWNWCAPAEEGVIALAITRHATPTVYASTYAGVFSTDASCGWTALNRGLTDVLGTFGVSPAVAEVVQDPATPGRLYAATSIGVFKSTDAGANWSPTGLFQRSALASIALAASFVIGGDSSSGTVTLVASAPEGGVTVALAAEIPGVVVPATVTIGAGLDSVAFPVSTDPALAYVSGTVTATLGDATRTAWLTVRPSVVLAAVSVQPATVLAGQTATGTVTLTGPAPAGGALVSVTSDPAVVTVATPIAVPQGSTSATFAVSTKPVNAATTVHLYAAFHHSQVASLTVLPGSRLNSLSVSPGSVSSGGSSIGTVRLSAGAPVGGAVIALSSSNPTIAAVPAAVTVAEGATSATFSVSTGSCTGGSVVISAAYSGDSQSAPLSVVLATDAVAVQRAEYFRKRQELRIAATSSAPSAVLQVFVASSGAAIGTLRNTGGSHSGQFAWPVNPQSILVRSSSCGSASSQVLVK